MAERVLLRLLDAVARAAPLTLILSMWTVVGEAWVGAVQACASFMPQFYFWGTVCKSELCES